MGFSVITKLIKTTCLLCKGECVLFDRLCEGCQADLPTNTFSCFCCAQPLLKSEPLMLCGICQQQNRSFYRSVIPLLYQYPCAEMLQKLKYMKMLSYGPALSRIMGRFINIAYKDDTLPQTIIPMPMHSQRLFERGYNQAGIIARHIGRELSIPVRKNLIKRVKATPTLLKYTSKARYRLLQGAFIAKKNNHAHIALVDDIVTSTASVETVAKTLTRAGTKRVDIWAVARTKQKY